MRKIIFVAIFIISSVFITQAVFAYDDKTTHPALTNETINFYNLRFDNKLSNEEKEWLIRGSILEDTEPRYINHFYDPVYKQGWTGEHGSSIIPKELLQKFSDVFLSSEKGVSALNWVHNQELQEKYKRYQGNRTWEKALYEYVKNKDKKEAFFNLGYVLHLLEDMSVPEHTRNDTHPGDSPYENYATRFTRDNFHITDDLQKQNFQPMKFNTLDEYFEYLANYSNNYFFSKDTINIQKYNKPEIIKEDNGWGYGKDKNGLSFLLTKINKRWNDERKDYDINYELKNNDEVYHPILNAYWIRLSREAVLAGAGVIDLFFQEAEKAEKDLSLLKSSPENASAVFSIYGEITKAVNSTISVAKKTKEAVFGTLNKIANFWNKYTTGQSAVVIQSIPDTLPIETDKTAETAEAIPPHIPPHNEKKETSSITDKITTNEIATIVKPTSQPKENEQAVETIPVVVKNVLQPIVPVAIFRGGGGGRRAAASLPSPIPLPPPDTTAPVITLLGADPVNVTKGIAYIDDGAIATDETDGARPVTTTGSVDTTTIGAYILTYTASDLSNNISTLTRAVNVVADVAGPVITILGNNPEIIAKNSVFTDAGATALDDIDGVLSVTTTGDTNVNTTSIGTYKITYTATDSSNNTSTSTRAVIIDDGAQLNRPNFVTVSGNYAYVTSTNSNSFEIIDISNPATLVHKSSIVHGNGGAILGSPNSVAISGNYAYVISSSNNLNIIDISNPILPVIKSTLNNGDGGAQLYCPTKIVISGNYAYIVSSGCDNSNPTSVEIVDIKDPISPFYVSRYFVGLLTPISSIFVSGDYLYLTFRCLCNGGGGFQVIDISNPAAPVLKSGFNDGDGVNLYYPTSIYVLSNYAYVTSASPPYALEIFNVSDPNNVIHKGTIYHGDGGANLFWPNSVFVSGNYAYITSSVGETLEIVDISDPANPVHKGSLATNVGGSALSYPTSVFVSGNYAYISSSLSNALEIVDISDPNNPIHKNKLLDGEFSRTDPVLNSEKQITAFNFASLASEVVGIVDETDHTISLTVPFGTNVTALAPTITISGGASVNPNNNMAQNFSNSVTYTVTAENGSTQNYNATVAIAPDSNSGPDTTPPVITSYTFNGITDNITINPLVNPLSMVFTASENVEWVSIKIEKENSENVNVHKYYYPGNDCDGKNTCAQDWNGLLTKGRSLQNQNGTYKVKINIKDMAGNPYQDYLSPYIITVNTN